MKSESFSVPNIKSPTGQYGSYTKKQPVANGISRSCSELRIQYDNFEGECLPCIRREGVDYFIFSMLDSVIKRLPSSTQKKLKMHQDVAARTITEEELQLLKSHKDLLQLGEPQSSDVLIRADLVKSIFAQFSASERLQGSWLLLNNHLMPYVSYGGHPLVPFEFAVRICFPGDFAQLHPKLSVAVDCSLAFAFFDLLTTSAVPPAVQHLFVHSRHINFIPLEYLVGCAHNIQVEFRPLLQQQLTKYFVVESGLLSPSYSCTGSFQSSAYGPMYVGNSSAPNGLGLQSNETVAAELIQSICSNYQYPADFGVGRQQACGVTGGSGGVAVAMNGGAGAPRTTFSGGAEQPLRPPCMQPLVPTFGQPERVPDNARLRSDVISDPARTARCSLNSAAAQQSLSNGHAQVRNGGGGGDTDVCSDCARDLPCVNSTDRAVFRYQLQDRSLRVQSVHVLRFGGAMLVSLKELHHWYAVDLPDFADFCRRVNKNKDISVKKICANFLSTVAKQHPSISYVTTCKYGLQLRNSAGIDRAVGHFCAHMDGEVRLVRSNDVIVIDDDS